MKKLILTVSLLLCSMVVLFSQTDAVEVTVHLKDGSTAEGLMKPDTRSPWQDQKSISIYDKSLKDEKRIKNKDKTKYKAKDIKAYEFEGRYFESLKISIAGRGEQGSTLGALPRYALVEKLVDGPISAYVGYAYPPAVVSGITIAEVHEDIRRNPEYFIIKEKDGKLKTMHGVNIEKWIKDSPEVSEKFANGEYGNFKRKKKKKFGNFLKGQLENENPRVILDVIKAYNTSMTAE